MPRHINIKNISSPTVNKTVYKSFRGVDFSTDPAQIANNRSPNAVNIISDSGGYPEKRLGWRTIGNYDGHINGIFFFESGGAHEMLIHVDDKIYRNDEVIIDNVNNGRSQGVTVGHALYILTGREYLMYDGLTIKPVSDEAYIPITSIPANLEANETFMAVNLLTPWRINQFIGNGEKKDFYLDGPVDAGSTVNVKVNGTAQSGGFTVDNANGKITFTTAPASSNPPGIPNIEVTFSSTTAGYSDVIQKCTIMDIYDGRIFFSGNPDYPNRDWHSEIQTSQANGMAYVADTSYADIGSSKASILGYIKSGDAQIIVKQESELESTVYVRTTQITDTDVMYPVKQGTSGVGALNKNCLCNLIDTPLFLSKTGLIAVMTDPSQQKSLMNKSGFVDARMLKEPKLKDAIMTRWKEYLVIVIDSRAYVADSRQQSTMGNERGYKYEWYYWENIPAVILKEYDDVLYFGTEDGRICRFNSDVKDEEGNILMTAYNDDGAVIPAVWSTKLDDDGDFMVRKTLMKKGSGVFLKTYNKSSVKVWIRTDADFGTELEIKSANTGIFDFNQLDFSDFTFNTLPENVIPLSKKIKKYKLMQIICKNESLNQGFGIYAIEKRFVYGNYVKR